MRFRPCVGIVALAAGVMYGGEALEGLSPKEQWACIKAHPAVVNPVGRDPDDESVLSLRGEWDFRTTRVPTYGNSPGREFTRGMSGFWRKGGGVTPRNGELRKIQVPGCWEAQGVGASATGLPCFVEWDVSPKPMRHVYQGSGWYSKTVRIPEAWAGRRIWLKTGWANSIAMFWVNGEPVAYEDSYCGTYKYEITDFVVPGSNAMVMVEVVNSVPSRRGGYNSINHWGGILRDIELEATPDVFIEDAWVRGLFDERSAEVHVSVACGDGGELRIENGELRIGARKYGLRVAIDGKPAPMPISADGSTKAGEFSILNSQFSISLADFRPWSPEHPSLYWAKIELLRDGEVVQTRRERFGVRKLEVRGADFFLNGRPFFMRGAGWHFVHPIEGAPLPDRETWLWKAKKVRSAGFNIVRTHTMCNMPEFFEACDEAGLMVQPELPYYTDIPRDGQAFDPAGDARELYEHYRRHPSFAVYSGGNEGWFGPRLTRRLYGEIRSRDPDRLMIGQDTWLNKVNNQPGMTDYSGGAMNVWPRGAIRMDMPFVCHEYLNLCIKLDSRLEAKYTGIYEPPVSRKARAEWLARFGLDHAWGDRLQDAQHAMQAVWRKYGLEAARVDPFCDGYSYWSLQDVASPQKGTFTGQALFDPFWGEKPNGERACDIAVYNSASCVLLTDGDDPELWPDGTPRPGGFKMFADGVATNRVRRSGETLRARFHFAHYGDEPLKDAKFRWCLLSPEGSALASGERMIGDQALGSARVVALEDIAMPSVEKACRVRLAATVSAADFSVSNSWNYWLFPRRGRRELQGAVACADAFAPALSARYGSPLAERDWRKAKVVVAPFGSELEGQALAAGKSVVSLANQTGRPDIFLGWWWMGDQMGAALKESPLLRHLPSDRFFGPLFFRIGKTGLKMPVEGFGEKDLVMVGEGAEACFLYLAEARQPNGARRVLVAGLDVLSDTAEGTAILDGALDSLIPAIGAMER